jgi:gamma-glutamyltranspeptidase/glutathione hydrolase
MSGAGVHAVTVPGAVAGWAQLHQRFGKAEWQQLFEAGIAYGERGFRVTEMIAEQWGVPTTLKTLKTCPESARVFLPGTRAAR